MNKDKANFYAPALLQLLCQFCLGVVRVVTSHSNATTSSHLSPIFPFKTVCHNEDSCSKQSPNSTSALNAIRSKNADQENKNPREAHLLHPLSPTAYRLCKAKRHNAWNRSRFDLPQLSRRHLHRENSVPREKVTTKRGWDDDGTTLSTTNNQLRR